VDDQFVIGPLVLRAERAHPRVLEIAEGAFDAGLAAVGLKDLRRRPRVAAGREDAEAEVPRLKVLAGRAPS